MNLANLEVEIPEAFEFLFTPSRFKVAHGGRGSAKSHSFAGALVLDCVGPIPELGPHRIMCTRETQNSIDDSVKALIEDKIRDYKLQSLFKVRKTFITGPNDSEFMFKGLRGGDAIRSSEGVSRLWVEEADKVPRKTWSTLVPTIRREDSEIWVTFNPSEVTNPTYVDFVLNPPPDSIVRQINFDQNPFFPEVLRKAMEHMRRTDPDAWAHVWGGQPVIRSDAQILGGKWVVDCFEFTDPAEGEDPPPGIQGPFFGGDWGFAQDPTTLVKMWIKTEANGDQYLFIERELFRVGLEISDTPAAFETIPGSRRFVIQADCARPETISHVRNNNFNIIGAKKWDGSVKDGIAYLRSFKKIIIHERCKNAIYEARLYQHKIDKLTGLILPDIIDKNNHIWDAVRYGLGSLIVQSGAGMGLLAYMEQQYEQSQAAK